MRFPGGAETGYYHWQHPGVNGYEDFWEPAADRAKIDPKVGRFQAVWVAPEKWDANTLFMSIDNIWRNATRWEPSRLLGLICLPG